MIPGGRVGPKLGLNYYIGLNREQTFKKKPQIFLSKIIRPEKVKTWVESSSNSFDLNCFINYFRGEGRDTLWLKF